MGEIWGYYHHTINAILTVKQANYKDHISTPQYLTRLYLCWFLTPRQWNRINPGSRKCFLVLIHLLKKILVENKDTWVKIWIVDL